jgi:hypothetical protein
MGMNLYGKQGQALAGMTSGLESDTETFIAGEKIVPGDPCFGLVGEDKVCYGAHVNAVKLTASADLVAGNVAAVVVNGINVGSIAFINSSEETLGAIAQAIDLNEDVRDLGIDAFRVEGNPLSIYLSGPGVTITATITITGGATQATVTSASYSDARFLGVARFQQLSYREGAGFYPKGVAVSVQRLGKIHINVADSASPDDKKPAYVILSGANAGQFTNESTSNYDCGCFFRSDRIDGNLALIELRGLK